MNSYFDVIKDMICRNKVYYCIGFIGLFAIILSIFEFDYTNCKQIDKNISNILSGLGTGLMTSLAVTVLINKHSDNLELKRKEEMKNYLISPIMDSALQVYQYLLFKLNKYLILSNQSSNNQIYKIYENPRSFFKIMDNVSKIEFNALSEYERDNLYELITIDKSNIKGFYSEFKDLRKNDFYLQGFLDEKETEALMSNYAKYTFIDEYANYFNNKEKNNSNIAASIVFFRITLAICSKIISGFPTVIESAKSIEENLKNEMDYIYYEYVYCTSDEYINFELEKQKYEAEHYYEIYGDDNENFDDEE